MAERNVTILGTGDYGRALAKCFTLSGFKVICGSRNPASRDLSRIDADLASVQLTNIAEAVKMSEVIFLAVPSTSYASALKPIEASLNGKVLVDVSNGDNKSKSMSVAEGLAEMFPNSKVVKAFNTISAYALEYNHSVGNRNVYICGDDDAARASVAKLAREIGLQPIERGGLRVARELEKMPFHLFPGWGTPTAVTLVVFCVWLGYNIYKEHFDVSHDWGYFPAFTMNKILGSVAITNLALCYLPGCLAGFQQLINQTKHKRFPGWLDTWLKMRKQLGLYALFFAAIHCVLSVVILDPAYVPYHFENRLTPITIPVNQTADMKLSINAKLSWKAETTILTGTLALILMGVQGIASIPAVGSLLNWREWSFILSKVGWFCFLMSIGHVFVRGFGYWTFYSIDKVVLHNPFVASLLPWFTLLLRLILLLPCFCIPLSRIRGGWEPVKKEDIESGPTVKPQGLHDNGIQNGGYYSEKSTTNL